MYERLNAIYDLIEYINSNISITEDAIAKKSLRTSKTQLLKEVCDIESQTQDLIDLIREEADYVK